MRTMLRYVFNRKFLVALAAGGVVVVAGAVVLKVAGLPEAWSWVVFLIAMLVASLTDREGFYGTPPRGRRG